MPWQTAAAKLIGELRPGRAPALPRFSTVIVSVPRQSGKTALSKSALDARGRRFDGHSLYGTAQSRLYAAKHLEKLGKDLVEIDPAVKIRLGVGAERITWPNGSIYEVISPNEGGGHGDSIDFMLVDEGWKLTDVVMGGIRPAMIARPLSQLLIISTMGTMDSATWNRLVKRGRESVDDPDSPIAYIEYSAETDEAVWDEDQWHKWMPALGRTISHRAIREAIDDMEPAEVIRAFGNRTTSSLAALFPTEWVEAAWAVMVPPPAFVLAVDVNEDPPGASIATAHMATDGRVAARLVDWRYGAEAWVPGMIHKIAGEREVEAIVADFGGPARGIRAELEAIAAERFIPLVDRKPRDLAADSGRFYDALRPDQSAVALERSDPLAEAIAGARRKRIGDDLWVVSRRQMVVDASPLVAVILAYGTRVELEAAPRIEWAIY